MRNGLYLIMILCTFLLSTQTKAQKEVKFNKDSIPPAFSKLITYYNQPEVYLSHWEKIKKDIDNKKEIRQPIYSIYIRTEIIFTITMVT